MEVPAHSAAARRPTPSTSASEPPWLAAVVDAAAVCKRGLAANQVLDIKQPDLHVVLAVLLTASVDVAEDMRQLYAVCDVLLDAGWLTLPEPAAFAESDLQQRLAQLQSTALVQEHAAAFESTARALLAAHPPAWRPSSARAPTPLMLWRLHHHRTAAPPTRKRKAAVQPPANAWFVIAPERSPMGISQAELARLFKRWMLRNHPDKGGDENVAAELNTLYTHAVGRNAPGGENGEAPTEEEAAAVYKQEQMAAACAWDAWRRDTAERGWLESPAFLAQRLLRGVKVRVRPRVRVRVRVRVRP